MRTRSIRVVWRIGLLVLPAIVLYTILFVPTSSLFPHTAYFTDRAQNQPCSGFTCRNQAFTTPRPRAKIVVVAYGRSGSSLTAAIIDRHPDVFSVFEPLFPLEKRHPGSNEAPNEQRRPEKLRQAYDEQSVTVVENFLGCKFELLETEDMANVQLRNLRGGSLLKRCVTDGRLGPKGVMNCFLKVRKVCLDHSVRQVKTVRLRGRAVGMMLARNSDVKVVFLVRDPRAVIASQNAVFWNMRTDDTVKYAHQYCEKFLEDLSAVEPLFDKYPNRIKLLRYETLAEDPIQVSRELYAFLGLSFTSDVRDYVSNSTSSGLHASSSFDTQRNSTKAAYHWRRRIHFGVARATDEECKDIYQKLGYVPVKTREELTDLRHKTKTRVQFGGKDI